MDARHRVRAAGCLSGQVFRKEGLSFFMVRWLQAGVSCRQV